MMIDQDFDRVINPNIITIGDGFITYQITRIVKMEDACKRGVHVFEWCGEMIDSVDNVWRNDYRCKHCGVIWEIYRL